MLFFMLFFIVFFILFIFFRLTDFISIKFYKEEGFSVVSEIVISAFFSLIVASSVYWVDFETICTKELYKVDVCNGKYVLYEPLDSDDSGFKYFTEFNMEDVEIKFLKSDCKPYVEYTQYYGIGFCNPVLYIQKEMLLS